MSIYRLKPNSPNFEIVDGPLAGRKYEAGQLYQEIPEVERGKFETIPDPEITKSEIREANADPGIGRPSGSRNPAPNGSLFESSAKPSGQKSKGEVTTDA